MPLASMSVFMWAHVSGCSLLQNVWVCFSRRRLNDAEWNTCSAWSAIESKGPLIALPHRSVSATNPYRTPPLHMLPTHPTPLRSNLSLKGRTNGPSKLFFSMSLSSQMTHVATPFALAIYSPHPLSPPFYTRYMFSIILPFIPTTNTKVSVMLSASWQSSGWCSGGMCAYVCLCGQAGEGGKAGLLCILSLI